LSLAHIHDLVERIIEEMSFKRHFPRGGNESILIGLRAVLGLGLLRIGPLGLN